MPEHEVVAANNLATGGLVPDMIVVLDVPPEVGRARHAAAGKLRDRMELADAGFHRRVAEAFRDASGPGILHVPADQPQDDVHAHLWAALSRRFPAIFPQEAG